MQIRDERNEDAAAIRRITTAAFAKAPHSSGTEARIVEALRQAGALTISLVATSDDGRIVGHGSPKEVFHTFDNPRIRQFVGGLAGGRGMERREGI